MFQCPLPMLSISRYAPFTAAIDLPDGSRLEGVPAASEAQAVHNLFESWHGTRLVLPLGQHITPLANATMTLCRAFSGLIEVDDELGTLIAQHDRQPLPKDDTIRAVRAVAVQTQYVVIAAKQVHSTLTAIATDHHARVMRMHPLTAYADMMAGMAMGWSKQLLGQLGLPGAITGNFDVNFDTTREETICDFNPGWPTEQADRWWEDRERRLQHYGDTLGLIAQEAPEREARIKDMISALREGVARHAGYH